ncbi:MAG: hypothetical protein ACOYJE_08150 [Bacteroidaceae bacterium]|jgi:hypothetical protein
MKKLSEESVAAIEAAVRKALASYAQLQEGEEVLTDLYVHIDRNDGGVEIQDDDDRVLSSATVGEWAESQAKEQEREREYKRELTRILHRVRDEGAMENLRIMRPYSFVLVDDRHETLAELMLVDDDTLFCDEELMTGLDRELDEFLENLMKE